MSLDDLKRTIKDMPISSILGRYLPLVHRGKDIKACCPFHDDRDPSLHINDTKGMYWCFPCQKGGDAIHFVMESKHLNYIDALKDICGQVGLRFEDYDTEKKKDPKKEKARELLNRATEYYRKQAQSGKFPAYQAFVQKRELPEEILERYRIGFSPAGNLLVDKFLSMPEGQEKQFTLNVAQEIGLIGRNDRGDYYDFFRERIMFPIADSGGSVIAFSARATKPEDEKRSKYINSKNSFMFNKSQALFGMNLAKSEIRAKNSVIILEGQMDQIMMNRHGFANGVAALGTAFTEENFRLLLNLTQNFYLAMDMDRAGQKAARVINDLCFREKIVPKCLDLSPQKDADEFLKAQGQLQMLERIEKARPYIDVLIDGLLPKEAPQGPNAIDQKIQLLNQVYELLAPLGEDLRSEERIKDAAKRLKITSDSDTVMDGFRRFLNKKGPEQKRPEPQAPSYASKPLQSHSSQTKTVPKTPVPLEKTETKYSKAEKGLIEEITTHPELFDLENIGALLDLVEHDEVKDYVNKVKSYRVEIGSEGYKDHIQDLLNRDQVDKEIARTVSQALFKYEETELNGKVLEKHLAGLNEKFRLALLRERKNGLIAKMKFSSDEAEKDKLGADIETISIQINNLKSQKK